MANKINVLFKNLQIGMKFMHKEKEYTKTNFQRGYYKEEGEQKFRRFNKKTLVKADGEYFYKN